MTNNQSSATGGDTRPLSHTSMFWQETQGLLSDRLAQTVPNESNVAYLDYPVHSNVGDLLIYLGTEAWFTRAAFTVAGRWNQFDFSFPDFPHSTIILCHGGGNFGDLYSHQDFREGVVQHYPDNRIVFLPQTIHYQKNSRAQASAQLLRQHSNLHLYLRDERSLEFANTHFSSSRNVLAPDMATFLFPLTDSLALEPEANSRQGVLWLLRQDIEKTSVATESLRHEDWTGDWNDMLGWRRLAVRSFQLLNRLPAALYPTDLKVRQWFALSHSIAVTCARRFDASSSITSNRLHGHILATLLDVQNELMDNSYGKNASYFSCWHSSLPVARLQQNPVTAS